MSFLKMWKTRVGRVVLIVGACFGVAWWNPPIVSNILHVSVSTIALPFQEALSFVEYRIGRTIGFLTSIGKLKSENERLERENLDLRSYNTLLVERKRENDALRTELGLLPHADFSFLPAEIIGRRDDASGGAITLGIGSSSGVRLGMAVVVGRGILVGIVVETAPFTSLVRVLTHSESSLLAVDAKTNAEGIVRGAYGLGLVLDRILASDPLEVGDEIITSGLGGGLPRGLLVGTIASRETLPGGLYRRATLVPSVDSRHIRFVAVITNNP